MLPGAIFTVDLYHRYYSTIRRPLPRNSTPKDMKDRKGQAPPHPEQEMGRI
jgi:hypothetical protein